MPGTADANPPRAPCTRTFSPLARGVTRVRAMWTMSALGIAATASAGSMPYFSVDTTRVWSATYTDAYPPEPCPDSATTRSPTVKPVTPSPSARTVPATSRPGVYGGCGSPGRSP